MASESVEKAIILNKNPVQIIKHPKTTNEELRRHYGLDSSSLPDLDLYEYINRLNRTNTINVSILIGQKKVKAIFLLTNILSDLQFLVPPFEFDLINPHNFQLLFQYNEVFQEDILPVFFDGSLPNSDFEVSTDYTESTNFHYILHFKTGEEIRFKKYTRYTIAQTREAIFARILSKEGFYPKFYSVLGINWDKIALEIKQPYYYSPLGLFIDNIQDPESVEAIFSSLYLKALRSPNQRSIGTIKTYQRELQDIIDFLEKFEVGLKRISGNEDLFNVMGDPKLGYEEWKNNFSKKLSRIKNKLQLPNFNFNEVDGEVQIIHGDCWLRQFIKSDGKILLLDLEDVCYGHRLYDLASLVNSIEQQNDYFKVVIAKEKDEINWIQDLKFSFMNFILEKIPQNLLRTFILLRIMRMIHELDYITKYQPYLKWQIEIMTNRTRKLAEMLQKKKFEYLELLNIE